MGFSWREARAWTLWGGFSLAFIVAFGGDTLRVLFLDRHPLFWIEHEI